MSAQTDWHMHTYPARSILCQCVCSQHGRHGTGTPWDRWADKTQVTDWCSLSLEHWLRSAYCWCCSHILQPGASRPTRRLLLQRERERERDDCSRRRHVTLRHHWFPSINQCAYCTRSTTQTTVQLHSPATAATAADDDDVWQPADLLPTHTHITLHTEYCTRRQRGREQSWQLMTDTNDVRVWPNVSTWMRDESRSRSNCQRL